MRWHRTIACKRGELLEARPGGDIWDFINLYCPLSPLEAQVLVGRYILGKGERELASELGLEWRTLNRAAWRMKAKLRSYADSLSRPFDRDLNA